ncbi:MAG: hypothetical protein V4819_01695 [Verrucomicrobiota bacterium]
MACKEPDFEIPPPGRSHPIDWSLVVVTAAYLIAAVVMWWTIHQRTGELSYTIDDAYIHGTLAKNIVANGTFGIIPGEFAAASSSLLWTLLLALVFFVTGPVAWIPAVLGTLFGALAIERANALLRDLGIGSGARAVVILMALACAPVLPILSTGMEHTLHAWTMVGLMVSLLGFFNKKGGSLGAVFVWALLAGGARYESLFALPPLLIFLALRRQWSAAFALGCGMALPGLAFAIYSVAHGGFPLPNSLIMKGNIKGAGHLRAWQMAVANSYILVLLMLLTAAAAVSHFRRKPGDERCTWLPVSLIAMIAIHLQLAQLGWFYRYEGYLIFLGFIAAATLLVPLQTWMRRHPVALSAAVCVILLAATFPLLRRSVLATGQIVHAAGNIHDQQGQMALVSRLLGPGARVAVNDLGAVSFFSDAQVLDLFGLGDNRLTRAKVAHYLAKGAPVGGSKPGPAPFLSFAHLRELAGLGKLDKQDLPYGAEFLKQRLEEELTDYVICYPGWFGEPNELPATLIPVEVWVLGDNWICGGDTVAFYGTSPEAAGKLAAALEAYRPKAAADPQSTNRMYPLTFN